MAIKYPYTDFHEMNLDWLLQQMKDLNERMDNFVTEITADIIPIVQQAIEQGLIDVTYDSTNETVVLVPGAGVTSQHLAKFFQINNFKYPVADQTARTTINNWISDFNYTPGNMYKKAVFIGDSYLDGWTPDGTYSSWGYRLASKLGLTVNTDAFIYSQGGSGFAATNNNRNFCTMLTEAVNDANFDNDDVDLIVAGGGANDGYMSDSDILSAINTFATIAQNFPNARVYVVDMYWSQIAAAGSSSVYSKKKVEYCYYNGATNSGLMCFSDCWKSLWGVNDSGGTLMASDDFHPNADGQEAIARAIFNYITSGSYTRNSLRGTMSDSATSTLFADITDSGVKIFLTGPKTVNASELSSASGSADGNTVYFNMPQIIGVQPVSNVKAWGSATVLIRDDNNYHLLTGIAGINSGRIRVYLEGLNTTGTGYLSLQNITYVQVVELSMFIPAIWA